MLTRDPRRGRFLTALVMTMTLGGYLIVIARYVLAIGYERDPSVCSPRPDVLPVCVAIALVGLSHVATRRGIFARWAMARAALGLGAIVVAALLGFHFGLDRQWHHVVAPPPWRRSVLDSQIYLIVAFFGALSHVVLARPRRMRPTVACESGKCAILI